MPGVFENQRPVRALLFPNTGLPKKKIRFFFPHPGSQDAGTRGINKRGSHSAAPFVFLHLIR
jgi:hypothetical protein